MRDFHALEHAHAERTELNKAADALAPAAGQSLKF